MSAALYRLELEIDMIQMNFFAEEAQLIGKRKQSSPPVIFLKNCVFGAQVKRPLLCKCQSHGRLGKSSNRLTMYGKFYQNRKIKILKGTLRTENTIRQTSSTLYIARAMPGPLKLKTSSSTGVFPSSGTEKKKQTDQLLRNKQYLQERKMCQLINMSREV